MKTQLQQRIQLLQDEITVAENKLKSNVTDNSLVSFFQRPYGNPTSNQNNLNPGNETGSNNLLQTTTKLLLGKNSKIAFLLIKLIRPFFR